MVKHNSIRVMLSVAARRDWEVEQLDVKSAFLNGDLEDTIYMSQPQGFEFQDQKGRFACLKRVSMDSNKALSRLGFTRSQYDSCVFVKWQ